MAATIKDVAKAAGVSPATVSRVIHENPRISAGTKTRVLEAMERLGYRQNILASSLAGKTVKTLGLILPNNPSELFQNQFFINVMRGISIYAQEHGYFLMYAFSENEDEEVEFLKRYIDSGLVAGIVLLTIREKDRCISYLNQRNFPFVVVGRPEKTGYAYWVDNDNFQAMYQVVNHLIERGFRRIAFMGGPPLFRVTEDRLSGFRQGLINRGIDVDESLIMLGSDFRRQSGFAMMNTLLLENPPDAVAATDDQLALGALQALQAAGFPPIAVTGVNNTPQAASAHPSLTSVEINAEQLGTRAAQLLIDLLQNDNPVTDHYLVDASLIERETSDPLSYNTAGL